MRKLGSFNRRVNLPRHPEDHTRQVEHALADNPVANAGYMFGVNRSNIPYEAPLPTTTGSGRPPRQRMAMDIMNITDAPGVLQYLPPPAMGGAESRVPGIPQP